VVFLLLGPLGLFIVFRVVFPLIWCVDYLFSKDDSTEAFQLVGAHLFYLLLQGVLLIILMLEMVSSSERLRRVRSSLGYLREKEHQAKNSLYICVGLLIIFFLLNFNSLPIFMEGGSDAIMMLNEERKGHTWFMYGVLGSLLLIFCVVFAHYRSLLKKSLVALVTLVSAVTTGKKASLFSVFGKLLLTHYGLSLRKPRLPLFLILSFGLICSWFIVFQFSRTAGFDFHIFEIGSILCDLIYSSSTVYLEQIIRLEGFRYAEAYAEGLGAFGPVVYILNPFTKVILDTGISKAPGPFLGEMLFNSSTPNGANFTLFFEYYFSWGGYCGAWLSFAHMTLTFFLARFFFFRFLYDWKEHLLVSSVWLGLFLSCFSFLADALYTTRSLPFVFFPLIILLALRIMQRQLPLDYPS
jgi:hypothetical protein